MVDSRRRNNSSSVTEGNGLFDGFEAYKTATEADYRRLLTEGIVVPDANVFLNLYRYNEHTRNDLFAVLRGLGNRLWVPHQVVVEFWRNRETVLQDPRDTSTTVQGLESQRDKVIGTFRSWANRVSLDPQRADELSQSLTTAFATVTLGVSELADSNAPHFARDTNSDPVLLQLTPIIQGRVGDALSKQDLTKAIADAKSRAESKIPPGYKDFGKDPLAAAGDYLVWIQTMHRAKAEKRDVLFITGDIKEDWWRRSNGELRGPRVELVEEIKEHASVRLFMLRTESLLLHARQALEIYVSDESVQNIERVDQLSASLVDNVPIDLELIRAGWDEVLESVKNKRKVAWLLLSSAVVSDFDADTLAVRFKREGDAKGFHDYGFNAILQEALGETLGIYRRIMVVSPTGLPYGEATEPIQRPKILVPGDRVTHDVYGLGVVLSTEGTRDDPEAKIEFGEQFGVKHLVLRYAPVSKL